MTSDTVQWLIAKGLAEIVDGKVRLTPYGLGTLTHLRWLRATNKQYDWNRLSV